MCELNLRAAMGRTIQNAALTRGMGRTLGRVQHSATRCQLIAHSIGASAKSAAHRTNFPIPLIICFSYVLTRNQGPQWAAFLWHTAKTGSGLRNLTAAHLPSNGPHVPRWAANGPQGAGGHRG